MDKRYRFTIKIGQLQLESEYLRLKADRLANEILRCETKILRLKTDILRFRSTERATDRSETREEALDKKTNHCDTIESVMYYTLPHTRTGTTYGEADNYCTMKRMMRA